MSDFHEEASGLEHMHHVHVHKLIQIKQVKK